MSRSALKAAVVALLLLHLVLGWSARTPGITLVGDDTTYLLLGRGVSHLRYTSQWLVGAPPHGQYPPVYPALLFLSGATAPGHAGAGVVLNLLLSTAALGLFAMIGWRWSPIAAVGALGIAAVNPTLVGLGGSLMSDPLFTLLLALTLWVVIARPNRWYLAVLTAVASALTRSIGVAVIAGLLIDWVRTRRLRQTLGLVVAALLVVGPWFYRAAVVPQQLAGQSYIGDALYQRGPSPSSRDSAATSPPATADKARISPEGAESVGPIPGITVLLRRTILNSSLYVRWMFPSFLALPVLSAGRADHIAWSVLLLGLGIVGMIAVARRNPVVPIVLCCYVGVLLIWPYAITRFLAPVFPLLAFLSLDGARGLSERYTRLPGWIPVVALAGVLMIFGLQVDRRRIGSLAHCDRAHAYTTTGCFSPVQDAFLETLDDASHLAPADAVFLSPKPSVVYYISGHLTLDDVYTASLGPEELDAYLRRNSVDFLLLSRVHARFGAIAKSLLLHCADWGVVVNREAMGAVLLRRKQGADATASSCPVIGRINLNGP